MSRNKSFLGVGWKFPPEFEQRNGSIVLVSEEEDIRESLYILLSTHPGERVMLPDYGCNLRFITFEKLDSNLVTNVKYAIENAVLFFEPRITLEEVRVSPNDEDQGRLDIQLEYTVRKTNTRSNMVYPYYIIEGTNVRFKPNTQAE
ncbi:GPW/gp25 family protein [Reichenbachiella versicolor]|uniref:GPW/gp25 family protein n=1 Tax=Reichenbachiella versicolor TaxID=1821036 RepID=UPI000D6E3D87|nr:GPW/gp25 family protein [Reichenbachiella versicolor]